MKEGVFFGDGEMAGVQFTPSARRANILFFGSSCMLRAG
jgi:hypothetical protein